MRREIIGKCFVLETSDDLKVLCHRDSIFSLQPWSSELNGEDIFLFWGIGLSDFKNYLLLRSTIVKPTSEVMKEIDKLILINIKITGSEAELL